MKKFLSIAFIFLLNNLNAQQQKKDLISIVGSVNYTIETDKEYLVLINCKNKNAKLSSGGVGVKVLFNNSKYYIITSSAGEFILSASLNNKPIGPPYKFISIKK